MINTFVQVSLEYIQRNNRDLRKYGNKYNSIYLSIFDLSIFLFNPKMSATGLRLSREATITKGSVLFPFVCNVSFNARHEFNGINQPIIISYKTPKEYIFKNPYFLLNSLVLQELGYKISCSYIQHYKLCIDCMSVCVKNMMK